MVDQIYQNVETGFVYGDSDTSSTSSYPRTICGQGFLLLLKKLRVIFLQDIVFFKVENPQHPEFLAFEDCLLTTCRDQDSPQEMKLKDVVPELEHVLTTLNTKMDTVATMVTNSTTASKFRKCSRASSINFFSLNLEKLVLPNEWGSKVGRC